jgi:hypothetical protein
MRERSSAWPFLLATVLDGNVSLTLNSRGVTEFSVRP